MPSIRFAWDFLRGACQPSDWVICDPRGNELGDYGLYGGVGLEGGGLTLGPSSTPPEDSYRCHYAGAIVNPTFIAGSPELALLINLAKRYGIEYVNGQVFLHPLRSRDLSLADFKGMYTCVKLTNMWAHAAPSWYLFCFGVALYGIPGTCKAFAAVKVGELLETQALTMGAGYFRPPVQYRFR